MLYEGQAPYRIPQFFKELVRDLSKQIDSKKIKEILDSVTAIYNEKVKEEKDKEKKGTSGAGKAKAQLKSGKQHLNQQLVSNLMGEEDEDEYGEEGYQRAKEEEYDFMWATQVTLRSYVCLRVWEFKSKSLRGEMTEG